MTDTTDTTDTTATDTTDTTDTGNLGCGELKTEADCLAAAGCQAVNGQPLIGGGLGMQPCLDPAEFLGCIPEQICGDALTWFCLGQDRYLVFDTCGPDGFDPCQGPPNIPMNCP